jgi:hypothetical protein
MAGITSLFDSDHSYVIVVKMDPSESDVTADLILTASPDIQKNSGKILDSLRRGDQINFKAKLISMGNDNKLTHLHAITIERTGNSKELESIIVNESAVPTMLPPNHDNI